MGGRQEDLRSKANDGYHDKLQQQLDVNRSKESSISRGVEGLLQNHRSGQSTDFNGTALPRIEEKGLDETHESSMLRINNNQRRFSQELGHKRDPHLFGPYSRFK